MRWQLRVDSRSQPDGPILLHGYVPLQRGTEAMQREGQNALAEIAELKPDIVFVLDDAAVRHVMMPLVGRTDISVVFPG